ncbi:hypothetical protein BGX29_008009, partial [Mortierella sp. GBA35]
MAMKWYLRAVGPGQPVVQYNIGYLYYHGQGVEQSFTKATEWFLKAAQQGFESAQYR